MTGNNQAKHWSASAVQTRYLVMPSDANPFGTAFGGYVMSIIDGTAFMVANRHAGRHVVTAAIDSLSFVAPIRVGDQVALSARVSYTGSKSMEVYVRVEREDPVTGESLLATTAFLTFVSLGDDGRPCGVPPLLLRTDDERAQFEKARSRVESRKKHRSTHEIQEDGC
jgi:acyl-CoA hydrolase